VEYTSYTEHKPGTFKTAPGIITVSFCLVGPFLSVP